MAWGETLECIGARMMLDPEERAQWAEWRTCLELSPLEFAWKRRGIVGVQAALIPPDANARSGFDVELLENVLHVFLDGARAAFQNFPDLVVTLSGNDPFHDFEFASSQIGRLILGYARTL